MKIKGLKKAVGEYQELNKGGAYSPHYGLLMFDISTGELWTDEFYSLGHSSFISYESDSIVNLGKMMLDENNNAKITMKTVKDFICTHFVGYSDLKDFYFTYGNTDNYPFKGGWTRVTAPSKNIAIATFNEAHPLKDNTVNCAYFYTYQEFYRTAMPHNGNHGAFEQEHLLFA